MVCVHILPGLYSYVCSFFSLFFQIAVSCFDTVVRSVRLHVIVFFFMAWMCPVIMLFRLLGFSFLLLLDSVIAGCKDLIVIDEVIVLLYRTGF